MKEKKITDLIENDHRERIKHTKKLMPKGGDEYEKAALRQIENRKFMNEIRPPNYWNFVEEGPKENHIKHVLRATAKPNDSYEDGRVQKILTAVEEIGMSLQRYEESKWSILRKQTLEIFKDEYKKHMDALAEAN